MVGGTLLALSHYDLVEKIGEGGMGVVWKARDKVLGRMVAIKLLPADVASDERRRGMFLDEARLASSVSDSHIVQVYELGREGGRDFIVMEYVEGRALDRILHGRPLPPEKVAQLGQQIAQALARAHRKGLIHRDLKPSNILVTPDGEVKVVDFGLATLFERRDMTADSMAPTESVENEPQSKSGRLIGTLPYMSPEQARAESLDPRSDIFSLGVVLYEMATGERPFHGATHGALLKDIVRARPRPPHQLWPKMPFDLERIILKALAPERGDRYQTMDDLAVDLKRLGRDLESGSSPRFDEMGPAGHPRRRSAAWIVAGASAATLVGAALWAWVATHQVAPDPHSVLVVPMTVQGEVAGGEFLGRAFAETIAVNLSRVKGVSVLPVPPGESHDAGDRDSLITFARNSGAGRILTGTLTRDGTAVHSTVSLVDPARNRLVWGAEDDVDSTRLGGLALTLTRDIVEQLGLAEARLYQDVDETAPSPPVSISPDYIATLSAFRRSDWVQLLSATRRLVAAFPDDVLSHGWYHRALGHAAQYLPASSPERRAVEEEARVVMRLDPSSPWVSHVRAFFEMNDGHLAESVAMFTQLLSRDDLGPTYRAFLMAFRAQAQALSEHYDAAFADLQEAERLDPLNVWVHAWSAEILNRSGRTEDALVACDRWIALSPGNREAEFWRGWTLYKLERWEEAVAAFLGACDAAPSQLNCAFLAMALQRDGRQDPARLAAAKAMALPTTNAGAYYLAAYRVLVGDRRRALDLLRQAIDLGACNSPSDIAELSNGQDFQALHEDPEFEMILAEARRRLAPR